jgi:hypothetical protein
MNKNKIIHINPYLKDEKLREKLFIQSIKSSVAVEKGTFKPTPASGGNP